MNGGDILDWAIANVVLNLMMRNRVYGSHRVHLEENN